LATALSPAKSAEPIDQPSVVWARVGQGKRVLGGGLEYEVPQKLTRLLQCIGNL